MTPRGKAVELDINLSTGSEFYNFLNNKKYPEYEFFEVFFWILENSICEIKENL
ncbi:hypothetical protein M3627_06630 [Psychrobacillus sp. MER TA 171]|nr:hypothetical protein [Psychrobacillus sp. MER TA 171]